MTTRRTFVKLAAACGLSSAAASLHAAGSLNIGVGQDGIFTQTASFNFDSSDNSTASPPGGITGSDPGSNGIGGCSSTAATQASLGITAYCPGREPIVSFDENGTLVTLSDTGHIIDTGNYDFINGSTDGNESIKWNLIGSEATRGGTIPEPSTWAMMLLGFAGLGYAGYRKTREPRTAKRAVADAARYPRGGRLG